MAKRKLSAKQAIFVDARTKGVGRNESAIIAGSTQNPAMLENSPTVQEEIARIRAEVAKNSNLTPEDVLGMFMEAAGYARVLGDAMGLIAAAREIGKMMGYYAPKKEKNNGVSKEEIKQALAEMTDEELYRVAHARTIEHEPLALSKPE